MNGARHTATVQMAQARATKAGFLNTCPGNTTKRRNEASAERDKVGGWGRNRQSKTEKGTKTVGIKSLASSKLGFPEKELKPNGW